MREFCTSGSVRGGDGNIPTYSARRLDNGPSLAGRLVEPIETGIGVRLHQARVVRQMAFGMLAAAVGRIEERRGRRIWAGERPVVTHVSP